MYIPAVPPDKIYIHTLSNVGAMILTQSKSTNETDEAKKKKKRTKFAQNHQHEKKECYRGFA